MSDSASETGSPPWDWRFSNGIELTWARCSCGQRRAPVEADAGEIGVEVLHSHGREPSTAREPLLPPHVVGEGVRPCGRDGVCRVR